MKYHFIGDQGVSMKGLKEYMNYLGNDVTGSDLKTNGHKKENITSDVDVVVRSSAINPGSKGWCEVLEAQRLGIKVIKRSELIGEITRDKKLIAISGMHGKTTITSMAGLLLSEAGFDPSVFIGEYLSEFEGGVRFGKSDWFVLEACEYDRSFLDFYPEIVILTNIEEEHLDTYPSGLTEIKEAFIEYLNHVPDDGCIIYCGDDENVVEVVEKSSTKAKRISYGLTSEKYNHLDFKLKIPGKHNVLNALSVVALADYLGIEKSDVVKVLSSFSGAKRRFEFKGNFHGADLIDDYGHHPSEIKATISALSEKYPDKHKIVVFWPHQYKRIKPLLADFGESFTLADEVIIKPIFLVPGRDEKLDVESSDIINLIKKHDLKKTVLLLESDEEIANHLKKTLDEKSVLLTIGIPPVYKIIEDLLKEKND